jgi:putative membrane protein
MKLYSNIAAGLMAVGMAALGTMAIAQTQPGGRMAANRMTADSTFVTKAAQGGMAEVKLGNLAKEKAESADVKNYGQTMVTDHTKINDELKQIATSKNITLPSDVDAKDQATYDRLSKLSGAAFDRAYMRDMVADHKADISEFKREADRGSDADLKAFASKNLPTLEHHLEMAESIEPKVRTEK